MPIPALVSSMQMPRYGSQTWPAVNFTNDPSQYIVELKLSPGRSPYKVDGGMGGGGKGARIISQTELVFLVN